MVLIISTKQPSRNKSVAHVTGLSLMEYSHMVIYCVPISVASSIPDQHSTKAKLESCIVRECGEGQSG